MTSWENVGYYYEGMLQVSFLDYLGGKQVQKIVFEYSLAVHNGATFTNNRCFGTQTEGKVLTKYANVYRFMISDCKITCVLSAIILSVMGYAFDMQRFEMRQSGPGTQSE